MSYRNDSRLSMLMGKAFPNKVALCAWCFLLVFFVIDIGTRWYTYTPKYIKIEVPVNPEEIKPSEIKDGASHPPQLLMMDVTVDQMKDQDERWMNPAYSQMDQSQKVWLRPDAITKPVLTYPEHVMKIRKYNGRFIITVPMNHKWIPRDLYTDDYFEDYGNAWEVSKIEVWQPDAEALKKIIIKDDTKNGNE